MTLALYYANGQLVTPNSIVPPAIGNSVNFNAGNAVTVPTMAGGSVLIKCAVPLATTGLRTINIPAASASGNEVIATDMLGNATTYNYKFVPASGAITGAAGGVGTLAQNWGVVRLVDDVGGGGWIASR